MKRTLLEIPIPFLHISIPIYSYGLMLMIGFLAGLYVARKKAASEHLDPNIISDLSVYTIISALIGARLFFIIQNFSDYKDNPLDMIKIYQGGLVYYGGLIAVVVALLVFARLRRISPLKLMDLVVLASSLGLVFGRIGCFLNGCCYGKLSNLPWAVKFPKTVDAKGFIDGSPVFLHHYGQGLIKLTDGHSLHVHPTQLYSSLLNIGIFFTLYFFFNRRKWDGQVTLLFLTLYASIRFCIELLRADNPHIIFGLTISQCISVIVVIIISGIFIAGRLKKIHFYKAKH